MLLRVSVYNEEREKCSIVHSFLWLINEYSFLTPIPDVLLMEKGEKICGGKRETGRERVTHIL